MCKLYNFEHFGTVCVSVQCIVHMINCITVYLMEGFEKMSQEVFFNPGQYL